MKIKTKILEWIYEKNQNYFEKKVLSNITNVSFSEKELENIFSRYEYFFELLLVKSFTGYIPASVNEPALNCFKEYGEVIERWTLWQSWYLNRRAIRDSLKITFYDGMMVYLKVLNTIARVQKKNFQPKINTTQEAEVEPSFIERALEGIKEFNENVNFKNNKTNKNAKGSEGENAKRSKT